MSETNETAITEPFSLVDTYFDDIAGVEIVGSNVRIWLCYERTVPGTGRRERQIVDQLLMPITAVSLCIGKVIAAIGKNCSAGDGIMYELMEKRLMQHH